MEKQKQNKKQAHQITIGISCHTILWITNIFMSYDRMAFGHVMKLLRSPPVACGASKISIGIFMQPHRMHPHGNVNILYGFWVILLKLIVSVFIFRACHHLSQTIKVKRFILRRCHYYLWLKMCSYSYDTTLHTENGCIIKSSNESPEKISSSPHQSNQNLKNKHKMWWNKKISIWCIDVALCFNFNIDCN